MVRAKPSVTERIQRGAALHTLRAPLLALGLAIGASGCLSSVQDLTGTNTLTNSSSTSSSSSSNNSTTTIVQTATATSAGACSISGLTPSFISPNRGAIISVDGGNFASGITGKVNNSSVSTLFVDASKVQLIVTPLASGNYPVALQNSGASATTYNSLEVVDPQVLTLSPAAEALTTGGTQVTLLGNGFQSGATVRFGGQLATIGSIAKTQIVATTPSVASPGAKDVQVTNLDGSNVTTNSAYTFTSAGGGGGAGAPSLTSISPGFVSTKGGALINVGGTNFVSGLSATVGATAVPVQYLSGTSIRVVAPALAAGNYVLNVTNPDASVGSYNSVTIVDPSISSVNPTSENNILGGTTISIIGDGFQPLATVKFGTVSATVTSVSRNLIIATTPAQATPGNKDVVVTNPDTSVGTLTNGYLYTSPLVVSGSTTIATGDASQDNKDVEVLGAGTLTVSGTHTFNKLIVRAGGTVTHAQTTTATVYTMNLTLGELLVEAGGIIHADGRGYNGVGGYQGYTIGNSQTNGSYSACGGAHGGLGGCTRDMYIDGHTNGILYDTFAAPTLPGSGGGRSNAGTGGNGGGVLIFNVTGLATVNGTIRANGGYVDASGGAGGTVAINAATLTGNGAIQANGAIGNPSGDWVSWGGGSGGGGRVAVTASSIYTYSGSLAAVGGQSGYDHYVLSYLIGEPGSVYISAPAGQNTSVTALQGGRYDSTNNTLQRWVNDSGTNTLTFAHDTWITNTLTGVSGLVISGSDNTRIEGSLPQLANITATGAATYFTIGESATFPATTNLSVQSGAYVASDGTHSFNNISLVSSAVLTHHEGRLTMGTYLARKYQMIISANNVSVDGTSYIHASGMGYPGANRSNNYQNPNAAGPNTWSGTSYYHAGGSYGGLGGAGNHGSTGVGATYGGADYQDPYEAGMGGGSNAGTELGGMGGGAIILTVAGTLTNNGIIQADGTTGSGHGGGGAGGSISLKGTGTLTGAGTIHANGGAGVGNGAGGGGGRIALNMGANTYTGTVAVDPGATSYGTPREGTIYAGGPLGNTKLTGGNFLAGNETLSRYSAYHLTIAGRFFNDPTNTVTGLSAITVNGGASVDVAGTYNNLATITVNAGTSVILRGIYPNLSTVNINGGTVTMSGTNPALQVVNITGGTVDMSGTFPALQTLAISGGSGHTLSVATNTGVAVTTGGASTLAISAPQNWGSLSMSGTSQVMAIPGTTAAVAPLDLTLGSLTVSTLARLHADTKGYLGGLTGQGADGNQGYTDSNTQSGGSRYDCGGSHGGQGGCFLYQAANTADFLAATYGSITNPVSYGGGGGRKSPAAGTGQGGAGGGYVKLSVTGVATVNGTVSANGGLISSGGGAGGSVNFTAGTLAGNGTIEANGGDGYTSWEIYHYSSGSGGGGRVAINATTLTFTGKVRASPGLNGYDRPYPNFIVGMPGSVYINAPGQSLAGLTIESARQEAGNDTYRKWIQDSALTALTWNGNQHIVAGNTVTGVQSITVAGGDISQIDGAVPNLATITVNSNKWIRIGATATLPAGTTLVINGGGAVIEGTHTFNTISITAGGQLTQPMARFDMGTGSVVKYPTQINATNISIDGLSAISLVNTGFPGAMTKRNTSNVYGSTPSGNSGASYYHAGGSHGGLGGLGNHGSSGVGAIYDGADVSDPQEPGAGGAGNAAAYECGGGGGGWIKLNVSGQLYNAGTINADGGHSGSFCSHGGGGAGGSIQIVGTGTLAGAGSIVARGGGAAGNGGRGGGGRIAIKIANSTFTGMISTSGATAGYGSAGAGTVYSSVNFGSATIVGADITAGNNTLDRFAGGALTISDQFKTAGANTVTGVSSISVTAGDVVNLAGTFNNLTSASISGGTSVTLGGTYTNLASISVSGGTTVVLSGSFPALTALNISGGAVTFSGTAGALAALTVSGTATLAIPAGASFPNTVALVTQGSSTTTIYSARTFASINMQNASVITTAAATTLATYAVDLTAASLTMSAGTRMHADGRGYLGAVTSQGADDNQAYTDGNVQGGASRMGCGGSHGGTGGCTGWHAGPNTPQLAATYGSITNPTTLGSGGGRKSLSPGIGQGGAGGGLVRLNISGTADISGTIAANGSSYGNSSGGAGGSVNITAGTWTGNGTIETIGGDGSTTWEPYHYSSGSGGGGRIAVNATTVSYTGKLRSLGGANGYDRAQRQYIVGEPGSIYINAPGQSLAGLTLEGGRFDNGNDTLRKWLADVASTSWTINQNIQVYNGNTVTGVQNLTIAAGDLTTIDGPMPQLSLITINSGRALKIGPNAVLPATVNMNVNGGTVIIEGTHTFNTISLIGGGTLTQPGSRYEMGGGSLTKYYTTVNATKLSIDSLSSVNVSGMGYPGCNIRGSLWYLYGLNASTTTNAAQYYAGGSHGGTGGGGNSGSTWPGVAYGGADPGNPTEAGGGGACQGGNEVAGPGGGAIKLNISGELNNLGNIQADGWAGQWAHGGGGAGGSIQIVGTGTYKGNGGIYARGGAGAGNGGRGGGGRVAIKISSITNTGPVTTAGSGSGYNYIYAVTDGVVCVNGGVATLGAITAATTVTTCP